MGVCNCCKCNPEPEVFTTSLHIDHLEGRLNASNAINNNRNDRTQERLNKLEHRTANLEKAIYNCDSSALREPITARDIDRWRAIEKAAELLLELSWYLNDGTGRGPREEFAKLREALKK